MQLLNQILEETVDPGYASAASGGRQRSRLAPVTLALVGLLAGVMIGASAMHNSRVSQSNQEVRAALINRIEALDDELTAQRSELNSLESEVDRLRAEAGTEGSATTARIAELAPVAGAAAVVGPGIRVTISDAPAGGPDSLVIDQDVRQVVNGLWQAGAEAITINGHRLSARTAIRQAGGAITVDYRSLIAPYEINAIGDPRTMASRFSASDGGAWLAYLQNNFGISFQVTSVDELHLDADPGLDVSLARRGA